MTNRNPIDQIRYLRQPGRPAIGKSMSKDHGVIIYRTDYGVRTIVIVKIGTHEKHWVDEKEDA